MKSAASRRGVALIIVLWLMAILTLLLYAFLGDMQVEYSVSSGYADGKKAEQLAWSAIDAACVNILYDTRPYYALSDEAPSWCDDPDSYFEVALGDGAFTVFRPLYDDAQTVRWGLDDEASKLNLNTATKEMLLKLPNVTEEIAEAILDWRDLATNPQPNGAESSYYNSLTPSYNCKNAPFETLEELLYVKGVTSEILFGEDANLNGVLEPNENDGDQSWPPDNQDGKIDPGLWSLCTVWSAEKNVDAKGTARANINGGNRTALEQAGLTPGEVQAIAAHLLTRGPFTSVAQLLGDASVGIAPILTAERFKLLVDKLTVATGTTVQGLVNINTAPKQVLVCLPGITDDIAVKIIGYRTTPGNALANIGWLLNVVEPAVLQRFANFITCRSHQFRINAVGRVGTPYSNAATFPNDPGERPRAAVVLSTS